MDTSSNRTRPFIQQAVNRTLRWFVRVPYWTEVRWISNSAAARATILIPLIGYWIILNQHVVEFTRLSGRLTENADGEPWRLFATYFGLCSVAVASALYQAFCPNEVKAFPSASAYVAGYFSDISSIEMDRVQIALENGDDASKEALEWVQHQARVNPLVREDPSQRREDAKRNTLQIHYHLCNRSRRGVRRTVAWCYRLGFVALLVPSIDIFLRVARELMRSVGKLVG
jgi:hypothetical protein